MRRSSAIALVLLALVAHGLSTAVAHDELDPAQDDPEGCTTATSESDDQCGAQGRQHFDSPDHLPPVEACDDVRSPAGSVVTRVLPTGPLRDDGSLAFVSGVCVYLPPGYESGGLRYPVVYLLHGGGGDQGNWVTMGDVQAVLDDAYASGLATIAVMPDGRSGQWYDYEDASFLIETYVLRHVVPFVDDHFRTIPDRSGRAIAGLSNGGYGAFHLAAKAPDLFAAAASMSGNLGARSMGGLGTPVVEGGPAFQEAGAYYYGNVPVELIANLDHVDLSFNWGATCASDLAVDLCATWGFEQAFRADNQHFRDELEARGYGGTYAYEESEGGHAWRWWTPWLRDIHLPFFRDRLAEAMHGRAPTSPLPDTFRYRSILPAFSVWGYDIEVDRAVREFLDLSDVRQEGLTVRGSGEVTITTAPRYHPRGHHLITGATDQPETVRADPSGRLRFVVDLGPSHTAEQYTPQARIAEAAGGYWTHASVQIEAA